MDKNYVMDIIRDAGFGFFATVDQDQPRVRAYMPHMTDEGELLISLQPDRRAIEHIKKNPKVEFCFVDRRMNSCRVTGSASMSAEAEKKELIWNNIPMLRQFFNGPEDENFKLMVVKIDSVELIAPQDKKPTLVKF